MISILCNIFWTKNCKELVTNPVVPEILTPQACSVMLLTMSFLRRTQMIIDFYFQKLCQCLCLARKNEGCGRLTASVKFSHSIIMDPLQIHAGVSFTGNALHQPQMGE